MMKTKKNVMTAISTLTDKLGYPPTVREIADAAFISVSVAHGHLDRLRKRGIVDWEPRRPRTIHFVRRGGRHEHK